MKILSLLLGLQHLKVTELLPVTGRLETVLEFGKRNIELRLVKNTVARLHFKSIN